MLVSSALKWSLGLGSGILSVGASLAKTGMEVKSTCVTQACSVRPSYLDPSHLDKIYKAFTIPLNPGYYQH